MPGTNSEIRLAARPRGEVKPDDWKHVTVPIQKSGEGHLRASSRQPRC